MGEYEELMDQVTFFIRTKKLQEELLDVNGMILTWIFHYCDKNNIPYYKDDNIFYLIKRSKEILAKINPETARSDDFLHREESDGDVPEPLHRFCQVLVGFFNCKKASVIHRSVSY